MKRPTWATIVGILAIIFGGVGIFGGALEMAMPSMLEVQNEMIVSFSESITLDSKDTSKMSLEIEKDGEKQKVDMSKIFEDMHEQFQFPNWYISWAMVIGLISMAAAALYFLSGIFILMTKSYSIKMLYIAIGVSIFWALFKIIIYSQSGNFMLMAKTPNSVASLFIDIILIIVVLVGSKEAFSAKKVEIQ